MKYIIGTLLIIFILLQARLWTGAGSLAEIVRLENEIADQTVENATLDSRNQKLKDEVRDLRNGLDSIEERARSELGMIRKGETFFLIVEDEPVIEQPPASFEESIVEPALEMPPEPSPESALDFTSDAEQQDLLRTDLMVEPQALLQTRREDAAAVEQAQQQERDATDAPAERVEPETNPYLELFRDEAPVPGSPQDLGRDSGL